MPSCTEYVLVVRMQPFVTPVVLLRPKVDDSP